ncbi:MAG: hypothetical protein RJA05_2121, partial [Planctomycetota bacterium]
MTNTHVDGQPEGPRPTGSDRISMASRVLLGATVLMLGAVAIR